MDSRNYFSDRRMASAVYLTPAEFARHVGYGSVQSIYRALRDGRIPAAKHIGRMWLIPIGAVIVDKRVKDGAYIGLAERVRMHRSACNLVNQRLK